MNAARHDVCVVGSANLDVVTSAARIPAPGETVIGRSVAEYPGGKGLNQAVAAARSGAVTSFVGAIGDDDAGRRLAEVLATERIDTTLAPSRRPTGRAIIVVDDAGENSIVVVPGANLDAEFPSVGAQASVVLIQLEIPLDTVEAAIRASVTSGSHVVVNPAPADGVDADLFAGVAVVTPNEHELELLGGPERILGGGAGAVVVTRGAAGAEVIDAGGRRHVPAHRVDPVDTTGAGDAFNGALAARLAAGDDLDTAVRWAVVAGALATTVVGAVPSQPTADAIRAAQPASG